MLSSALVVFREVLEAAIVIGIVMAATVGVARRNAWIAGGVGGGLLGAALVAGFAGAIAGMAAGMGQELFNAGILFTAVLVLGWSVVWMGRHGREMAHQMNAVGQAVSAGNLPMHMLGLVVGLAVLREGAETVLFLYGISAAPGTTGTLMMIGGFGGLAAGAAVGWAMYRGLLKISTKHLFTVTSWLLALLAAGMASQGAGYLMAAGVLPPLVETVWDTSAILSERNLLGQFLHTLVGYDARPAGIQVLFYAGTLGALALFMRRPRRRLVPPAAQGRRSADAVPSSN